MQHAAGAADDKGYLSECRNDAGTILPSEVYHAYKHLIAAFNSGKQEQIEKLCLPGTIKITTDPRPPRLAPGYGADVNLPFLRKGFDPFILKVAKVSDTEFGIRTATTGLLFTKTRDGNWKL